MLGLPTVPSWALFLLLAGTCAILLGHAAFMREGFRAGEPGVRCGVDLPGCSAGKWCINGFCEKPDKPNLPPNELPVYP